MLERQRLLRSIALTAFALLFTGTVDPAAAQAGRSCHGGQSFDQYLAQLKQDAIAAGVSQSALASAAPGMVYD